MFTGEFEASNLSFGTLPYTSHVILLLFVVLVTTVLVNLLNSLAVRDTGEIRRDAERLCLATRAKLISRIESLVNSFPNCMKISVALKEEMFVIQTIVRNIIGSAAVPSLLRIIKEKTKPHEKDKSTAFQKEWRMFTEKFSALELRKEKLEE